jgi:hypothetical protein
MTEISSGRSLAPSSNLGGGTAFWSPPRSAYASELPNASMKDFVASKLSEIRRFLCFGKRGERFGELSEDCCHPLKAGWDGTRWLYTDIKTVRQSVSNEHGYAARMYGDHFSRLNLESDILLPRPRFALWLTALDSWTGRVAETRCGTPTPTYSHSTNSESLMSETLGWSSGWSNLCQYLRTNHGSEILPPPRLASHTLAPWCMPKMQVIPTGEKDSGVREGINSVMCFVRASGVLVIACALGFAI